MQYVEDNLGVMSVGFLLASPSDAVIWRGPKKNGEYKKKVTNHIIKSVIFTLYWDYIKMKLHNPQL